MKLRNFSIILLAVFGLLFVSCCKDNLPIKEPREFWSFWTSAPAVVIKETPNEAGSVHSTLTEGFTARGPAGGTLQLRGLISLGVLSEPQQPLRIDLRGGGQFPAKAVSATLRLNNDNEEPITLKFDAEAKEKDTGTWFSHMEISSKRLHLSSPNKIVVTISLLSKEGQPLDDTHFIDADSVDLAWGKVDSK